MEFFFFFLHSIPGEKGALVWNDETTILFYLLFISLSITFSFYIFFHIFIFSICRISTAVAPSPLGSFRFPVSTPRLFLPIPGLLRGSKKKKERQTSSSSKKEKEQKIHIKTTRFPFFPFSPFSPLPLPSSSLLSPRYFCLPPFRWICRNSILPPPFFHSVDECVSFLVSPFHKVTALVDGI